MCESPKAPSGPASGSISPQVVISEGPPIVDEPKATQPLSCEDRTACVKFDFKLLRGFATCGAWGEARARIVNECSEAVKCRFFWMDVENHGNHPTDVFELKPGQRLGGGIDGAYACYQLKPPTPGRRAHVCVTHVSDEACLPRKPPGT